MSQPKWADVAEAFGKADAREELEIIQMCLERAAIAVEAVERGRPHCDRSCDLAPRLCRICDTRKGILRR